jgi:hypothetical protein
MRLYALAIAAFASLGCTSAGVDCLEGDACGSDPSAAAANADAGKVGPTCSGEFVGRKYVGLGNEPLETSRSDAPRNIDRARTKPYSALVDEYPRALGVRDKPPLLQQAGGTFGEPDERWYVEPMASAVLIKTAYDIAFLGCASAIGTDPKYAAVPDDATARAACGTWARRFWSRDATPQQIESCVAVATTDSAKETYGIAAEAKTRDTTPRRRWTYACASVLTSAGFIAY